IFCWYGSVAKCYVYLDDLRRSWWFTRGWTLQEVIVPKTVEFFSKEGAFLGDKQSLEQPLCDITSIPARALRGDPLPGFTVAERMAWAKRRETTRLEDRAYSLLGIQYENFAAPFSLYDNYSAIFWINIKDEDFLKQSFLLVYDNYDNPKLPFTTTTEPTVIDIRKYFSEAYQGLIIITTRLSQVKIGYTLQMAKLRNLDNSLEILRTTLKR
ncbi:hypothetical protein F5Y16DRAFT_379657, partial [Xylariaceae sp. FL0255]